MENAQVLATEVGGSTHGTPSACDISSASSVRGQVALLTGVGLITLVANLLDSADIIGSLVYRVYILLVTLFLCGWLIRQMAKYDPPRSVRRGAFGLVFAMSLLMLMRCIASWESVEQSDIFKSTELLRLFLTQSITIVWAMSPFMLTFLAMRSSAVREQIMDQRVEERTRELLVSNKRLQEEIRQRAQAENKLELAMQDVQKLAEQRSQQLEAVQAHVERHERLRALGQMASGIAHELNNKLAPIVTYAEMVRREAGLDERQGKRIDAILQSARDAANVINNLQSFHGDQTRELRKSVSMTRLVEQVKYLTRPFWKDAAEAEGRKIRFEVESADVPPVMANPVQLRQVLTNLILNAVDSISESGVITVRLESSADAVSFTVSDDGQGMTIEDTKRCFEPFFTTKEHGTGLGLSVCHGIIQAHGGTLEVESSLAAGTCFRVVLPSCLPPAEDTHRRPADEQDALPFSLLLVDDNDSVRKSTKQVLEILGAKVTEAHSAFQALRSLRQMKFDAVVTDLGMPEMDGCELIEHMREEGIAAPAILMSGWPAAKIRKRTEKKAKPAAIVKKPATTQELVNAIQDVISEARQRNSGRRASQVS